MPYLSHQGPDTEIRPNLNLAFSVFTGEEHAEVEPAAEGLPNGDEPGGAAGAANGPAGQLCCLPGDGEGSS